MKIFDELLLVLVITAIGICIGFGVFLLKHQEECKNK